jgi:hypothetical protein
MRTTLASIVMLLSFCETAVAQFRGAWVRPRERPAFSPYLNLNRFGASPAINYFGLVKPQLQSNANFNQIGRNVTELQQREPVVSGSELPETGHRTGFLNHHRYFLNTGGTAAGAARR